MPYYASITCFTKNPPVIITEELFELLEKTAEYMDSIQEKEAAAAVRNVLQQREKFSTPTPAWDLIQPITPPISYYVAMRANLPLGTKLNMGVYENTSKENVHYDAHCRWLSYQEQQGNPHIQMGFECSGLQ